MMANPPAARRQQSSSRSSLLHPSIAQARRAVGAPPETGQVRPSIEQSHKARVLLPRSSFSLPQTGSPAQRELPEKEPPSFNQAAPRSGSSAPSSLLPHPIKHQPRAAGALRPPKQLLPPSIEQPRAAELPQKSERASFLPPIEKPRAAGALTQTPKAATPSPS